MGFPSIDSLRKQHNGQVWDRLKPGARSVFCISHEGVGPKHLDHSPLLSRHTGKELDRE